MYTMIRKEWKKRCENEKRLRSRGKLDYYRN